MAFANNFSSHEMTILNNKLGTGDINSAVDQVSDIFISAANRCLTKIRRKKKKSQHHKSPGDALTKIIHGDLHPIFLGKQFP